MANSAAAARVEWPILVYTCWTWCSAVRREIASRFAISAVRQAGGQQPDHLDLTVGEAGRPVPAYPGARLPGTSTTAATQSASRRPAVGPAASRSAARSGVGRAGGGGAGWRSGTCRRRPGSGLQGIAGPETP